MSFKKLVKLDDEISSIEYLIKGLEGIADELCQKSKALVDKDYLDENLQKRTDIYYKIGNLNRNRNEIIYESLLIMMDLTKNLKPGTFVIAAGSKWAVETLPVSKLPEGYWKRLSFAAKLLGVDQDRIKFGTKDEKFEVHYWVQKQSVKILRRCENANQSKYCGQKEKIGS